MDSSPANAARWQPPRRLSRRSRYRPSFVFRRRAIRHGLAFNVGAAKVSAVIDRSESLEAAERKAQTDELVRDILLNELKRRLRRRGGSNSRLLREELLVSLVLVAGLRDEPVDHGPRNDVEIPVKRAEANAIGHEGPKSQAIGPRIVSQFPKLAYRD